MLRAGQLRDDGTLRVLLQHAKGYCVDEVRDLDLPGTDAVRAELDLMLLYDEHQLRYTYDTWASRVCFMHDDRLGDEPAYHMGCPLIFEGAQGILLDESYGFHPHTTWSNCTTKNALTILSELEDTYNVTRLGVTRTYMTRHGRGPFPSEDETMTMMMHEPHNGYGSWQEGWRCGFLDIPHLQYAIEATDGIDGLVITHMDKVPRDGLPVVMEYWLENDETFARSQRVTVDRFRSVLAHHLDVGVYMTSWGPTANDKKTGKELVPA
jgi:adenylosuccinate synthase